MGREGPISILAKSNTAQIFSKSKRLDHKIWTSTTAAVFLSVNTLLHYSNGFTICIWTPHTHTSTGREQQHLCGFSLFLCGSMSQLLCWPWRLLLSLEAAKTRRLTEGLMRPLLTLLNVDSCNLNSCCHQISLLGWRVEIIGKLCVWTGSQKLHQFCWSGSSE